MEAVDLRLEGCRGDCSLFNPQASPRTRTWPESCCRRSLVLVSTARTSRQQIVFGRRRDKCRSPRVWGHGITPQASEDCLRGILGRTCLCEGYRGRGNAAIFFFGPRPHRHYGLVHTRRRPRTAVANRTVLRVSYSGHYTVSSDLLFFSFLLLFVFFPLLNLSVCLVDVLVLVVVLLCLVFSVCFSVCLLSVCLLVLVLGVLDLSWTHNSSSLSSSIPPPNQLPGTLGKHRFASLGRCFSGVRPG